MLADAHPRPEPRVHVMARADHHRRERCDPASPAWPADPFGPEPWQRAASIQRADPTEARTEDDLAITHTSHAIPAVVPRQCGQDTMSTPRRVASTATAAWRSLAPSLAARRSMRVWRGPGRGYDQVRKLATVNVPTLPAALPLYTRSGWTRTLALDFDIKLGSEDQLTRDVQDVVDLVTSVGGRVIVDRSPAGGRHVWIPLWTDHRLDTLLPVLHAMRARWPTLDITPMTNPASGCLTGPGSPCIGGGHRELVTDLDEAVTTLRDRCPPGTLGALRRALLPSSPHPRPQHLNDDQNRRDEPANAYASQPNRGLGAEPGRRGMARRTPRTALDPALHAFATTGVVPPHRIGWTRSEARMAVLAQSHHAGLTMDEVHDCITSGLWGGLGAAYDKYGRRWERRFEQEWHKAGRLLTHQSAKSHNPEHKQHVTGGVPWQQQWLAQALSWLSHRQVPNTAASTSAAVLQALNYIGWLSDSRLVAPGGRWLSIAAGMLAEATVWLTLRTLASLDGAPIRLATRHHGPHADTYELVTPRVNNQPVIVTTEEALRVRVGKVPAVWRTIGHGAREAFELIEDLSACDVDIRKSAIKRRARTSSTAVDTALARLTSFGLIENHRGSVRRTPLSLDDIAREYEVQKRIDQRLERHREERRSWWMLLELWVSALTVDCPDAEQLPDDPLCPADRDAWLQAVMATGPPPDPYRPSARERHMAVAVTMFRDQLGAVLLGGVSRAAGRSPARPAIISS